MRFAATRPASCLRSANCMPAKALSPSWPARYRHMELWVTPRLAISSGTCAMSLVSRSHPAQPTCSASLSQASWASHGLRHTAADKDMTSLVEHLSRTSRSYPDAFAVEYRGTSITYSELASRSSSVAWTLIDARVAPGDRVALWLNKSVEAITILYGI